jgi:hypothetical protein
MEAMRAARPRDHGSGQKSGWAAAGQSGLSGCADGARVPGAGEPWAPAQHKWDPARAGAAPPRPAAAPPHPHPAAVAAPGPAAAPPVRTRQLLLLVLLDPDLLLPLLLVLLDQAVLLQLDNKVNNYFPSRTNKF